MFKRLESLRAKADEAKDLVVAEELERLRSSELVREIEESVSAAKGDADAAEKAEKRLLELKVQLDDAENLVKWPSLLAGLSFHSFRHSAASAVFNGAALREITRRVTNHAAGGVVDRCIHEDLVALREAVKLVPRLPCLGESGG